MFDKTKEVFEADIVDLNLKLFGISISVILLLVIGVDACLWHHLTRRIVNLTKEISDPVEMKRLK